jgi:hypothetical protein
MRLRSNDVVAREIGDEVVILDVRASRYLSVTGIGPRVLEMLATERSPEELTQAVLDEYDVEPAVARADVEAFLADLRAAGLVEE